MLSEVVIALPERISPVHGVRSTLLQSSLNTLRKRGHFEAYLAHLDPSHRAALLETLVALA